MSGRGVPTARFIANIPIWLRIAEDRGCMAAEPDQNGKMLLCNEG
jgi:hypothetical protein